jgi:hypothetical protein
MLFALAEPAVQILFRAGGAVEIINTLFLFMPRPWDIGTYGY